MCGIAGIFQPPKGKDAHKALRAMGNALAHRGPDATGYLDEDPIWLMHGRLSILDTSERGNQPMVDHTGRYVIIFNGEVYNYKDLRAELKGPWHTGTDTEVILAAYAAWGADCLHRFNGMFALAIWDRADRKLFVARDRMGIKPLYYHREEGTFAFASELRALVKLPWVTPKLDRSNLVNYLCYQTVYGEGTLVEGIKMLGPGQFIEVDATGFRIQTFWNLFECATDEAKGLDREGIQKRVRELLSKSVARRLIADVPLGAFLSGGIDSSAIVALMSQASTQPVDTFSVVFNEKEYDESEWSGLVAKKYNTRHHPILLKPADFLAELPNALRAMDHPSGDGINSYVVSKVTRAQGIKVALSGLGGDELFAGYPVFTQLPEIQRRHFLWMLPYPARKALRTMLLSMRKDRRAAKIGQILRLPGPYMDAIYKIFRTIYEPARAREMVRVVWSNQVGEILSREAEHMQRLPNLSKISVAEIGTYTQSVLLRDTDQMSMAHALEVRVPFFDHTVVRFVLGIPDVHKRPSYPKQLLVESLGDLLPKEIVHRPKMGFVFPWSHWIRGELREFCDLRIRRQMEKGIIDPDALQFMWEDFQAGREPWLWTHVWLPVVLDEWMENNGIHG